MKTTKNQDNNIAIELKNVSKKYTLRHEKPTLVGNILGERKSEDFCALKNINLTIKKREKVACLPKFPISETAKYAVCKKIAKRRRGIIDP